MELIHGGDVHGYRLRHGRMPLDFSASLNPLGMPVAVQAAAREAVGNAVAYPDPLCRRLVAKLAGHLSVPESFLFCGNGAADVIYRWVQAVRPGTALLVAPTFVEYERALETVGCRLCFHALSPGKGFALESDILGKIVPGLEALFLCQPNNPTGRVIEPELLSTILERCAAIGVRLFLDECFCAFIDDPARYSLVRRVGAFPNLCILGSFTKLYGMAGIRLGYGVSGEPGMVEKLAAAGPPWAVSAIAQEAGIAALDATEYVDESRGIVRRARKMLVEGLERLGFVVYGADANFVFFQSAVDDLDARMMREGLLIRGCGNFRGLEKGYYRVAVRLERENELLLRAIANCMNG